GMRTLLSIASTLVLTPSSVIMLDEPDAHLHSHLQRQIAALLNDNVTEANRQIIAATHAPDYIAEVPADSLVWVDRKEPQSRAITDLARLLTELGAISNSDAILSQGTEHILYIEGSFDRTVLRECFAKLPFSNPFEKSSSVLIAKLPDGKGS